MPCWFADSSTKRSLKALAKSASMPSLGPEASRFGDLFFVCVGGFKLTCDRGHQMGLPFFWGGVDQS